MDPMGQVKPLQLLPFIGIACATFLLGLAVASDQSAYEFFRDFKEVLATLLTGFFGFWGIIYTLDHSARSTRDQMQTELDHGRELVRRALLAELGVIGTSLKSHNDIHMRTLAEGTSKYVPTEFHVQAPVYSSITGQLGVLEVEQVQSVVRAYTNYLQIPDLCRMCNAWEAQEFEGEQKAGGAHDIFYQRIANTLGAIEIAKQNLGG